MIQAILNRLRAERVRYEVSAFEPAGEEQARLRLLVISAPEPPPAAEAPAHPLRAG